MKKVIIPLLVVMFFMSSCLEVPLENYQVINCKTSINPQLDTIHVGDTLHLENVIDNFYTVNNKTFDISDKDIVYGCIVKPYTSEFSITDFDSLQSNISAFDLVPDKIIGQGEIFNFQEKNQCLGGYYLNEADKMYANVYLVAKDTGVFILKSYTEPVKTHKIGFAKQDFVIDYTFDISDKHLLNEKLISDKELLNKYYLVVVKP